MDIKRMEENMNKLINNYYEIKREMDDLKDKYVDNKEKSLDKIELEIDNIILKKQNEYLLSQINYLINEYNTISIHNENSQNKIIDNSIKIGDWCIKAEYNDLCFYKNELKIAKLSQEYDVLQIYRNKNGKKPYFYYNSNGGYGEWKG